MATNIAKDTNNRRTEAGRESTVCDFEANGGKGTMCLFMESYLQEDRKKGIRVNSVVDLTTFEEKYALVSYHGSAGDKGLVLNFCPFCGYDLKAYYKRRGMKTRKVEELEA